MRNVGRNLPLPAGEGSRRSASITKTTVHSVTYVTRSNSLPRQEPIDESPEARLLRKSETPERSGSGQHQAPRFLKELEPQILAAPDRELVLSAQVGASPDANFQWMINGAPVRSGGQTLISSGRNQTTLTVSPPVPCGDYTVIATNAAGSASFQAIVYSAESEEGRALKPDERPRIVENFTRLVRTDVQREEILDEEGAPDAGDTVCIYSAQEPAADGRQSPQLVATTTSQSLELPSNPAYPQKPVFVEMPASQFISLRPGQHFQATVRLNAHPPAAVRWYFKNDELKDGQPEVQIQDTEANVSTLLHRRPDTGMYRAVAMNEHGITALELRVFANDEEADQPLQLAPAEPEPLGRPQTPPAESAEPEPEPEQTQALPQAPATPPASEQGLVGTTQIQKEEGEIGVLIDLKVLNGYFVHFWAPLNNYAVQNPTTCW